MTVFRPVEFASHEQVVHACDSVSGLRAIIAIHDTTLGPAAVARHDLQWPAFPSAAARWW